MKKLLSRNKKMKQIMAITLCICLAGSLFPITAAALEGECDLEECLGRECTVEDCLCICHKETEPAGETVSESVTVQTEALTEPTETTCETEASEEPSSVAETMMETTMETTEETVVETTEETVAETTGENLELLTVTWLDQKGEVIAAAEKEFGSILTEEDFPALEQVGWYICGEDGLTVTETPARAEDVVEASLVIRAVDRSVALTVAGEFTVGSDVTLNVIMTGFAGTEYAIQWQNCPIDEAGTPVGEWASVEGATGEEYTYTISEDAQNLSWRVVVTLQ